METQNFVIVENLYSTQHQYVLQLALEINLVSPMAAADVMKGMYQILFQVTANLELIVLRL